MAWSEATPASSLSLCPVNTPSLRKKRGRLGHPPAPELLNSLRHCCCTNCFTCCAVGTLEQPGVRGVQLFAATAGPDAVFPAHSGNPNASVDLDHSIP